MDFETWLFSLFAWQVLVLIFCGEVDLFLIFGARTDNGRPTQARFWLEWEYNPLSPHIRPVHPIRPRWRLGRHRT
ncbi:MAG TPA: hypothetical protein VKR26_01370, partial [Terriglobales bacterium]|nr:hypothetical protein [Terriglobales bacterium]